MAVWRVFSGAKLVRLGEFRAARASRDATATCPCSSSKRVQLLDYRARYPQEVTAGRSHALDRSKKFGSKAVFEQLNRTAKGRLFD